MKNTFLFLTLLIAISCSDDNLTTNNLVKAELANIQSFKDGPEILAFVGNVNKNKLDPNVQTIANKTFGKDFESSDEVYRRALAELSKVQTIEEQANVLNEYSDVIMLVDSSYVPRIKNYIYRTICNRDGLYVARGYLHKVIDDQFIVYTDAKNIAELMQVSSVNDLDLDKFKIAQYQNFSDEHSNSNGRSLATCGNPQNAEYFDNHSKCKDDRTVNLYAYASYIIAGAYYTPRAIVEAYGRIRTGVWCNWNQYQTVLATRNSGINVLWTINNSSKTIVLPFADYNGTTEVYEWDLVNGPIGPETYWNSGPTPTIAFSAIHAEATSRGVSGNWVIMDCR